MVKWNPLRIGRKKSGKVSIADGEFKMVVKERARLIGVVSAFFITIGIIIAIVAPYLIIVWAAIYGFTATLMSGLLDIIIWSGNWIKNRVFWVGTWVIRQPIDDYRYGRKKRKELEDKKVYAE